MPYQIKDHNHTLKIHLKTALQNITNLYLQTYINNSNNVHNPSYIGTLSDDTLTFSIPHNDFNINDEITKMKLVLNGTTNLYDLNEGISVLVDGEETDVFSSLNGTTVELDSENNPVSLSSVKQKYFALLMDSETEHDVQAVFKGNKAIGVALSNKFTFIPKQPADDSSIEGAYKLTPVKFNKTMTYMENIDWQFLLTKGETPISGKTVEVDLPNGQVYSYDTNSKGIRQLKLDKSNLSLTDGNPSSVELFRNWNVGTYTVLARFYHYDDGENTKQAICKTSNLTLKITKGTPLMSFTGASKKGKQAKFKLKDPQGFNYANKKISITVGGKTYYKTTNSNGNAYLTVNSKGYKKYKVKYNGDKNLKSKTWTFTETVG